MCNVWEIGHRTSNDSISNAAGGIQMTVCLIIISIVLAHTGVGQAGVPDQPWVAWFTLVFICIYIAAYAWSCMLLLYLPFTQSEGASLIAVRSVSSLMSFISRPKGNTTVYSPVYTNIT